MPSPASTRASRIPSGCSAAGEPRTIPHLGFRKVGDGWHQLEWCDEGVCTRTSRPAGVDHLELRIAYGRAGHIAGPDAAEPYPKKIRRHVFKVEHDRGRAGEFATYWARWVSEKGIAGAWSVPQSMTVSIVTRADAMQMEGPTDA